MVRRFLPLVGIACIYQFLCVTAFVSPGSGLARRYSSARTATASNGDSPHHYHEERHVVANTQSFTAAVILSISILCSNILTPLPALAAVAGGADAGASIASNSKITTGGASTLQSGRTIAITRGVNLDNSNFAGANLKGVAFQQSIVRDADFSGSKLVGASFFDATVDGSNFEGAGE